MYVPSSVALYTWYRDIIHGKYAWYIPRVMFFYSWYRDVVHDKYTFYMVSMALEVVFMILGSIVVAWFSRYREFRADAGGARLAG